MKYDDITRRALNESGIRAGNSARLLEKILTLKTGMGRGSRGSFATAIVDTPGVWNYDEQGFYPGKKEIVRECSKHSELDVKEDLKPILRVARTHARKFSGGGSGFVGSNDVLYALAEANPEDYLAARILKTVEFSGEKVDLCVCLMAVASDFF